MSSLKPEVKKVLSDDLSEVINNMQPVNVPKQFKSVRKLMASLRVKPPANTPLRETVHKVKCVSYSATVRIK